MGVSEPSGRIDVRDIVARLEFDELVFLAAWLQHSAPRKTTLDAILLQLGPNSDYQTVMVDALIQRGLLVQSHEALVGGGRRTLRYRVYREPEWILPRYDSPNVRATLEAAIAQRFAGLCSCPHLLDDQVALWKELGIAECLAYIEHELASHRFEVRWADALAESISNGLQQYSIGQMFYFAWTAVRDLASQYLRQPASPEVNRTYFERSFAARIDRAARGHWDVRPYSRQWSRRDNIVAQVFSGAATGLGAKYLEAVPNPTAKWD